MLEGVASTFVIRVEHQIQASAVESTNEMRPLCQVEGNVTAAYTGLLSVIWNKKLIGGLTRLVDRTAIFGSSYHIDPIGWKQKTFQAAYGDNVPRMSWLHQTFQIVTELNRFEPCWKHPSKIRPWEPAIFFRKQGRWGDLMTSYPSASQIEERTASLKPSSWLTPSICAKLAAQSKLLSYLGTQFEKKGHPKIRWFALCLLPRMHFCEQCCTSQDISTHTHTHTWPRFDCHRDVFINQSQGPKWLDSQHSTLPKTMSISWLLFNAYHPIQVLPPWWFGVEIASRGLQVLQVEQTHPLNYASLIYHPVICSE